MKEIISRYYEASDGKIFENYEECKEYEKKYLTDLADSKEKYRKLKAMEIPELSGTCPLSETDLGDSWNFKWFNVRNEEELAFLNGFIIDSNAYADKYPAIICVETDEYMGGYFLDDEKNLTGSYAYSLEECINETKEFFAKFGFEIELKKKGD